MDTETLNLQFNKLTKVIFTDYDNYLLVHNCKRNYGLFKEENFYVRTRYKYDFGSDKWEA